MTKYFTQMSSLGIAGPLYKMLTQAHQYLQKRLILRLPNMPIHGIPDYEVILSPGKRNTDGLQPLTSVPHVGISQRRCIVRISNEASVLIRSQHNFCPPDTL